MKEKNIFAYYKLFLSLNISDFNFLFLLFLLKTPLKKVTRSVPATPFKSLGAVKPLPFLET